MSKRAPKSCRIVAVCSSEAEMHSKLLMHLPRELLLEIFNYSGNLKNLLIVNRTFNQLISQSLKLMRRLTLVIEYKHEDKCKPKDVGALMASSRKYNNAKILGDHIHPKITTYLKASQAIANWKWNKSSVVEPCTVQRVLKMLSKMTSLQLEFHYKPNKIEVVLIELPELRCFKSYAHNIAALKHFMGARSLNEIQICELFQSFYFPQADLNLVVEFLSQQLALKKLKLNGFLVPRIFSTDHNFLFQLTSLEFHLKNFQSQILILPQIMLNFKKFLRSQKSITNLAINVPMLDQELIHIILKELPELKVLIISYNDYAWSDPFAKNLSITRLIVMSCGSPPDFCLKLLEFCPNVEFLSVDLCNNDITYKMFKVINHNLLKLKKIHIAASYRDLFAVQIPTVVEVAFSFKRILDTHKILFPVLFLLANKQVQIVHLAKGMECFFDISKSPQSHNKIVKYFDSERELNFHFFKF